MHGCIRIGRLTSGQSSLDLGAASESEPDKAWNTHTMEILEAPQPCEHEPDSIRGAAVPWGPAAFPVQQGDDIRPVKQYDDGDRCLFFADAVAVLLRERRRGAHRAAQAHQGRHHR
uniref:Uncharacterized protein n=1 Tax=Triticum urartu TaxID=4572 RepID=A0A8R7K2P1_TRIUA